MAVRPDIGHVPNAVIGIACRQCLKRITGPTLIRKGHCQRKSLLRSDLVPSRVVKHQSDDLDQSLSTSSRSSDDGDKIVTVFRWPAALKGKAVSVIGEPHFLVGMISKMCCHGTLHFIWQCRFIQ